MNIGVIGHGVVGKAACKTLEKEYSLVRYDKYQDLDKFENLLECKFVFIMVPTPFDCELGQVDDSAIIETLEKLEDLSFQNIVIIKSTVPPGSCQKYIDKFGLKIAFNPEFLRESITPDEDFQNQNTVVIGTSEKKIYNLIVEMYKKVLLNEAEYFRTSITEAEMIKCAQNTMLASRVALANMIFDACEKHNISYDNLRKIAFDRFEVLGPHMTQVPGPDGKRGFGGKCLPKDIRAFQTVFDSALLKKIIDYNDTLRDDLSNFLKNYKNS